MDSTRTPARCSTSARPGFARCVRPRIRTTSGESARMASAPVSFEKRGRFGSRSGSSFSDSPTSDSAPPRAITLSECPG